MKHKIGQFLIIFALSSIIVQAGLTAPAYAGDLMQLYDLALKQDPVFRGAVYQDEASKETLKQAYSDYYPSLIAEGSYSYTEQEIISSDNTVFEKGSTDFDTQDYSLTLTQPLFNYGSIVKVRQAKSVIRRSDMELELARQELIIRVAESYLKALAARDELSFARAEEEVVKKHLDEAGARHEAGLIPVTDLYDARARNASVQAQRVEAEQVLGDALESLKEIAGGPFEQVSGLKEEVPLAEPAPPDTEQWVNSALQNNLRLKIQRREVEIAEQEVKRQKSGHYPTLDLIGRYNRQETDGTLFGGGSDVETKDVMLNLRIPIFEGGVVSSRTREAKSLYVKSQEEMNRLTRSIDREVRTTYSGVRTAISKVQSLERSVESQELVLESKQHGFDSGLFTSLAVLDAGRDLYFYKKDHAKARYDYILNNLKLRQAVGTLTVSDLGQVDAWLVPE